MLIGARTVGSLSSSLATRMLVAFAEQALMSLGSFSVSWCATRELGVTDLANFFLVWAWAWGGLAVVSETLITPLRVLLLKNEVEYDDARDLVLWGGLSAGLLAIVALFLPHVARLAIFGVALSLSSAAMMSMRLLERDHLGAKYSIVRVSVYWVSNVVFLGVLVVSVRASVTTILGATLVSTLISSVPYARSRSIERHSMYQRIWNVRALLTTLVRTSYAFGLATGLRFSLYSGVIIIIIRNTQGAFQAAVFSSVFVLTAPLQLLSSSLPLSLMPALARAAQAPKAFRRIWTVQGILYLAIAMCGCLGMLVCFHPWLKHTIGDPRLARSLAHCLPAIMLLILGLLLSSWSSSAQQALRQPRISLAVATIAGAGTCIAALLGLSAQFLAGFPYVLGTVFASICILATSKGLVRAELGKS